MEPPEVRKNAREQLRAALSARDGAEKNFHVRQAMQLLHVED